MSQGPPPKRPPGPPPPPPPPAKRPPPPPVKSEFVPLEQKVGPSLSPELQGIPLVGQMYRVRPEDSLDSIAEALLAQGVAATKAEILQAILERNRRPSDLSVNEALLLARGVLFIPRLPKGPPPGQGGDR